jgi:competence protein ComEC
VQWVCFLGLLPITLLYFQQISLVMFFANALAIPWVGFVIVPLCFLASVMMLIHPILAYVLFSLVGYLFWPLWKILTWMGALPYATWHHIMLSPLIFVSSMLAVILFLAPRGWPARYLGFIFVLPLFFCSPEKPRAGEVWLTVLDVGQGLATVIQTRDHTLVYDAGPKTYGGFDSGESVVLPYLRRIRLKRLDMMIISHTDNDHLGGASAIALAIPTLAILTSNPTKLSAFSAKNCAEGQEWNWDGVAFRMLNPPENEAYLGNNSSCVLQIRAGNQAILLPGDIEKAAEERLVGAYGYTLKSTVLVAPHHGSKTSSSEVFLAAVQPLDVIAANGFYNQFKFPSRLVLARYAAFHAKLHDTATQGAIQVRILASGLVTIKQG